MKLIELQILIIEDNRPDADLIRYMLSGDNNMKYNLEVAADVADGLKLLKQKNFDVIMLDINLPKKDGREVLTEIKNNDELKRIPVVILITSSAEEDVLKTYDLHANCYITKLLDLEQFVKVIKSIEDFWLTIVKLPADK